MRIKEFIFIGTAGAAAYTLTADSGSYAYTGTDATLTADYVLTADAGSYTYTGNTVDLEAGKLIPADTDSYTYSGSDVSLTVDNIIDAAQGTYTYTGTDADLNYGFVLTSESDSYTYTGQTAELDADFLLDASQDSYTYTGTDVTLTYTPVSAAVWYVDDAQLREPNLWIPGKKPVGAVKIDWGHPLTKNLTNFWIFRHNHAFDLTGEYPATRSGVVIDAPLGEVAASFTGTAGDESTVTGTIETGTRFSALFRMYATDFPGTNYVFGGYGTSETTDKLSCLGFSNDNLFFDYGDTSSGRLNSSYLNYYNKWTDVAFTMTNTPVAKKALYFDSLQRTTAAVSDSPSGDVDNITFGSWPDGSSDFIGSLSYVMFFNIDLSQSDIRHIHSDPYQFLIPA